MHFCSLRWPRGLRDRTAAPRLLGLWVRIPPRAWMSLCCECSINCQVGLCVKGRSLARMSPIECGVSECDLSTTTTRRPRPTTAVEPYKNVSPDQCRRYKQPITSNKITYSVMFVVVCFPGFTTHCGCIFTAR
jgi:hypothetical protein